MRQFISLILLFSLSTLLFASSAEYCNDAQSELTQVLHYQYSNPASNDAVLIADLKKTEANQKGLKDICSVQGSKKNQDSCVETGNSASFDTQAKGLINIINTKNKPPYDRQQAETDRSTLVTLLNTYQDKACLVVP
jgi:hypothetical protein